MIEKIKKLMDFTNMNQKQLAHKLGLTPVAVSRYLAGKRKPTIDFAVSVSNAFGVSLDWLLKEEY